MTPKSKAKAGDLKKRLETLAVMAGSVKTTKDHAKADLLLASIEKHLRAAADFADQLRTDISMEEPEHP